MSGVKRAGGAGGGSAGKPKVQSNNLMSYFGKKTTTPAAPAAPTPAPNASAPQASSAVPATPPRGSASTAATAGSDAVATAFFSNAPAPVVTPSKMLSAVPVTPTSARPSPSARSAPASGASLASSPAADAEWGISASGRKRKQIKYNDDEDDVDDEDIPISAKKKSKRRVDDDEYDDDGAAAEESEDDGAAEASESDHEEQKKAPPARSYASKKSAAPSSASKKAAAPKKAVASAGSDDEEGGALGGGGGGGDVYQTDFLLPQNRKDKKGIRPGQTGYDHTSLYIPPAALAKFTPAERQYWDIKSNNMDLVLFFKIGKFYELFDEDAAVGVKELDLSYMLNQKRPHAGFPEAALNKYAEKLVSLGYKIGQVDQTETPEMLKQANAQLAKGSKKRLAVDRQLSTVLTPGTLVDGAVLGSDDATYLLALIEQPISPTDSEAQRAKFEEAIAAAVTEEDRAAALQAMEEHSNEAVEVGFTFVDCCTGHFTVGQTRDDKQRSFLKTLIGFVSPREVVLPRGGLSEETLHILRHELRGDTVRNEVTPVAEFWPAARTIHEIHSKGYFNQTVKSEVKSEAVKKEGGAPTAPSTATWPAALQQMVSSHQNLGLSSFGAIVWYLRRTLHDFDLLSQRHVRNYFGATGSEAGASRVLALDGQTLANLEVVRNQRGGTEGTLIEFVDRTCTPFGKRRLRDWLMKPLFDIDAIAARQDAVAFFMTHGDLAQDLRALMKKLPDLERGLSRVHANGIKKQINVIMYENVGAKQLDVFLKTIDGFSAVAKLLQRFDIVDPAAPGFEKGSRVRALVTHQSRGGLLPDFEPALNDVRSAFDPVQAKRDQKITPNPGYNEEYDACIASVQQVKGELQSYLARLQRDFKDSGIKWMHKNKERYQIEIPIKTASKQMPPGFDLMSSNKTCKRFWTRESRELADRLAALELEQELYEKDMSRAVFAAFAAEYQVWIGAVEVIAELDCLMALAVVSQHHLGCVRPTFVPFESNGGLSKLDLRGAVHPALYERDTVGRMSKSSAFIANDTVIGCEENPARFILVSGPNMGGKSTLLRQTCCAVILAQLGCWVPADRCELTPVDRIFTRVGANDKIMQGLSTFHVELLETASILKNATNRSLVILDELGRGTSTFDGTAIAHAVIQFLGHQTGCMTLFATHYHMLMDEFKDDPLMSMYHMACKVNSDETDITFLYKFLRGVCPKSYGSNVAKAAGLAEHVLLRAQTMSDQFEKRCVEAMGVHRARLHALFPPQQSSTSICLPVTTTRSIAAALESADETDAELALLRQFKEKFEISAKQAAKKNAAQAAMRD